MKLFKFRVFVGLLIWTVEPYGRPTFGRQLVPSVMRMDTLVRLSGDKSAPNPEPSLSNPAMFSPTINLHPKGAMRSVEVEMTYDNASFPIGFSVSLMMDPNGTASDCGDPTILRKIRDSCTPLLFTNHHVKCENLQSGLYCARAHELLPGGKSGRFFFTNMTRLEDVSDTAAVTLSASQPIGEIGLGAGKLLSIGLGVGCSIVALVLLGLLFMKKRPSEWQWQSGTEVPITPQKMNLIDAVRKKQPLRTYIMYYPDCCHHVNFVESLAKFLGYYNCEVSYDQKEMNSIAVNSACWIQKKLSGRYKILVINSTAGFKQQQLWRDNSKVLIPDSVGSDTNMFLSALAIISHNVQKAFDYPNLYMLRPSYVSKLHLLRDICPGKFYDVPTHLDQLIRHLHDIDPQEVDESDMWGHCASAYDDLLQQARFISGSGAIAENSRLDCICHACVSSANPSSPDIIVNGTRDRLLVT